MGELESKAKSFWNKPEGVTGWIILAAIAGVVIYMWGTIVPFILLMMESTVKLIILGTVVAAVVGVVSDARARAAIGIAFKGVCRLLTNAIVKIDPLGILKDHIDKLRHYLDDINTQMGIINGQSKSLQNAIVQNNKAMQHSMTLIEAAKQRNEMQKANLEFADITRKKQSNEAYMSLLQKIDMIYKFLCKMRDNSEYILEDTVRQVDEEERKYKTINAASGALSKVKKFFNSDDVLYNDALAQLEENFTQKLGAIDDFMVRSKGVLDKMDLNNEANLINGIKLFDDWEKDNAGFFSGMNVNVALKANDGNDFNFNSFQLNAPSYNNDFAQLSPQTQSIKSSKFLD